jgi:hypothetical protein
MSLSISLYRWFLPCRLLSAPWLWSFNIFPFLSIFSSRLEITELILIVSPHWLTFSSLLYHLRLPLFLFLFLFLFPSCLLILYLPLPILYCFLHWMRLYWSLYYLFSLSHHYRLLNLYLIMITFLKLMSIASII